MTTYTTQMDAARKGIVTPQIKTVAEKEHMPVEKLMELVAEGKVAICANKHHTCLNPEGVGSMLRTKINVNLGVSRDCKDYDIEMQKVMKAVDLGAEAIMDLSSHGNTQPFRQKLTHECPAMIGTVPVYDSVIHYQRDLSELTAHDFIDVIRLHAEDGVDFVTLHCGITRKTIEQIKRAHQGDKTAREALVKDNLGLVWSIVRRFAGRGCETEDLFQIGSIGLLKAIDKFDLSYEVRFSTYAVPMIAGEIKRFLRDDGIIKVSRSIKEQNQRLRAARDALCTALGREPTLEELAAQIGVSCEEAAASMAADSPVESLSAPASAGEETGLLLQDRIAGETAENEVLLDRMLLGDLLKMLNGRQREIIVRHYFYDQTQTQIAAQLGISQVQVSRIERKILGQMRAKLEET